jgi:hypothetical protein
MTYTHWYRAVQIRIVRSNIHFTFFQLLFSPYVDDDDLFSPDLMPIVIEEELTERERLKCELHL